MYSLQVVKLSVEPRSDGLFSLTLSGQKISPKKIKNGPKTSKLSLATLWQESLGSSRNYDEISETGFICHTMLTLRRNLKIIADISLIFLVFILPPSIYHPIPREWALSCGILKLWNFIILWSLTKVYS